MAKKLRYLLLVLFVVVTANSNYVSSQEVTHFKPEGKIEVHGTSSIHDWEMSVSEYQSQVSFILVDDTLAIQPSAVSAKTSDLLSDSRLMNNKAHDALKEDEYKTLEFKVIKEHKLIINAESPQFLEGVLSVAGVDKSVRFTARLTKSSDRLLQLQGELELKMSDFRIEPPTAMMGALKTGDDIKIIYDLFLEIKE